jgi:hypothetical protein
MLTPEQLGGLPVNVVQLFQDLEEYLIADIVRRISGAMDNTGTSIGQLRTAYAGGFDLHEIETRIKQTTGIAHDDIERIITEAFTESVEAENVLYAAAGKGTANIMSPLLSMVLANGISQTQGELRNFTQSLGFATKSGWKPIAQAYQNELDRALMKVVTGAADRRKAVRDAVVSLADGHGLSFVDYKTGHINRLDVAVERAVRTGANQMCTQGTIRVADMLGAEYFETTAHSGARPTHAEWQGQVFHRGGDDGEYRDFEEVTGYGSVGGLCGANCRHSFFPFFPGISAPAYSKRQLDSIDNPPFEYNNGKTYTQYEAAQRQRALEREIRKEKRKLTAYAESPANKMDYENSAIRMQLLKQEYRKFSAAAGLPIRLDRQQVYGFGRSTAQKARWAGMPARKTANTGIYVGLKVPIQKRFVYQVAEKYGVDMRGITVKILKGEEWLKRVFVGRADPDNVGWLYLFPQAFTSERELVRTLLHEKTHIAQFRKYGVVYVQNNHLYMEKVAERFERLWYNILAKRSRR